jgi:hypothetical protein
VAGHPVQDRLGGEEQLLRAPAGRHLVPADRRRHHGTLPGPQRVGGHGGLGPVVLAPVDEDLAGPQGLGHARHDQARLIALEPFGEGPGLIAGLLGGHAGDRGVQLQALAARGLGQRREALGLQQRPQVLGHPAAVHDVGRRTGVQVEDQQVGLAEFGHPPLRYVQFQAGQVGGPNERGQVVHHQVGHRAGAPSARAFRGDPGGADPVRPVFGDVLLEEGLAADALGIALQGQRPVGDVRQQHGRHPLVVVEHLGLGKPGFRVQDLTQVGQGQRPAVDLDRDLGLRTHGPRPWGRCRRAGPYRPGRACGRPWSSGRRRPG